MTPFAIVGTIYLILLAICFAVSAASLAVIAYKLRVPVQSAASDLTPAKLNPADLGLVYTSWPTKNGASVEHGEG